MPKEAFLTPLQSPKISIQNNKNKLNSLSTSLQSPKINLVAQHSHKTAGAAKKRPSFIQKDPNNPFNNSMLWNTDESNSLDEQELLVAQSMPKVVTFSDDAVTNKEKALLSCDDDNTSVTVPSDDSSFTGTPPYFDDSTRRDDEDDDDDDPVPSRQGKVKKTKKDSKNEAKQSKTRKGSGKLATTTTASSTTRKRSKSKDRRSLAQSYTSWDFGKVKHFHLPPMTTTTRNAVILIQRMMRGWWRRLQFRVQLLTYRLENKEHLTSVALEKVWTETEEKKNKFYDIMKGKLDRRQDRELEKTVTCRNQGQQIIEYLRKDNKKIREDSDRIKRKFKDQKEQQDRLITTSDQIAQNMEVLQVHTKRFQETHDQLMKIEPVYKDKVATLEESYAQAKAYCDTEHICKLKYLKAMEKVVTMVQDRCSNRKLVDKVVDLMLSIDVD